MISKAFADKAIAGYERQDFTGWKKVKPIHYFSSAYMLLSKDGITLWCFICSEKTKFQFNDVDIVNIMCDGDTLTFHLAVGTLTCPIQKEDDGE
jgi:hypothetical protein